MDIKNTTTIRVSRKAHGKLRTIAYKRNMKIVDVIDEFVGIKDEGEPTMVEQLLKKKS